jgi:uncharacterized membrane protein YczE
MIELIGLLLPPLIDLISYLASKINDSFLSSQFKFWMSFTVCGIIGIAIDYYLIAGIGFGSQDSIAASILSIFGASQISYKVVWENTPAHKNLGKSN